MDGRGENARGDYAAGAWTDTIPEETHWDQNETLDDNRNWENTGNTDQWNEIQPDDSVSNAEWHSGALTPPPLHTSASPTMYASQWGAGAQYTRPFAAQNASTTSRDRNTSDMLAAQGMQAMLGAIAQQRQAQFKELESTLQQLPQRVEDSIQKSTSQVHRHRRNPSEAGNHNAAAWGQSHDTGEWQGNTNTWMNQPESNSKASFNGGGWGSTWEDAPANNLNGNTSQTAWGHQEDVNGKESGSTGWDQTAKAEESKQSKGSNKKKKKSETEGQTNNPQRTTDGWGTSWDTQVSAWSDTTAPQPDATQTWNGWSHGTDEDTPKPKFFKRIFMRLFRRKGKKEKPHVQFKEDKKKSKTLKKQKSAEPEGNAWPTDNVWPSDNTWAADNSWSNNVTTEPVEQQNENTWTTGADDKVKENGSNAPWGETSGWGIATPKHSKAYSLASEAQNSMERRGRSDVGSGYQFEDPEGYSLEFARRALYSEERLARYRIIWGFDPNKDLRVSTLLGWIQQLQHALAIFGLQKFLQTRERGALFTSAEYMVPNSPTHRPAFSWLTYGEVQRTKDKTLQESLKFYHPSTTTIVFVYLLSKSHSSMAIWRRKLPLPSKARQKYAQAMEQTLAGLRKDYEVHVDEIRGENPRLAEELTKRKWAAWGR